MLSHAHPLRAALATFLVSAGAAGDVKPSFRSQATVFDDAAHQLAVADFNNDGLDDVALVTPGLDLMVMLSTGNGFVTKATIALPGVFDDPQIAMADLNVDGRTDLIAATTGANIQFVLQRDDGSFELIDSGFETLIRPDVAPGDFNTDGAIDFATVNPLAMYFNDGAGNFVNLAAPDPSMQLRQPVMFTALEVVGVHGFHDAAVSSFELTDSGAFEFAITNFSPENGFTTSANFNQDEFLDLAAIQAPSLLQPNGSVLVQFGLGLFLVATDQLEPTLPPQRVALGDINGDGFDDVIAAGSHAGFVRIDAFLNQFSTSTSAFSQALTVADHVGGVIDEAPEHRLHDLTIGDFNGDGPTDLVVAGDSGVVVLFNGLAAVGDLNGDGFVNGADLAILLSTWGPCDGPCVADFTGDGVVDGADLARLLTNWGAGA